MFKIFTLFVLDLKLAARNFFTTIFAALLGTTGLVVSYFLLRFFSRDLYFGMSLSYWAVLVATTIFALVPAIFRDYRLGLTAQFSLAGIEPFEYFIEKITVALIKLLLPLAVYGALVYNILGLAYSKLVPLAFFTTVVTLAVLFLATWLAGISAEVSAVFFGFLILPFLVPLLLAARNLLTPLFGPGKSYPLAWIYWLLSYVVILFIGLWLTAEFLWEEF